MKHNSSSLHNASYTDEEILHAEEVIEEITESSGLRTKQTNDALALYLLGHGPKFISKRVGLSEERIHELVRTGKWKQRRAEVYERAFKSSWTQLSNNAGIAQNIAQTILNEQLMKKMESGAEMDWDELKKLSDMIIGMQKVSRTEEGKPTEYTQHLTLREMKAEIKAILKNDPFQEFIGDAPTREKVTYKPDVEVKK